MNFSYTIRVAKLLCIPCGILGVFFWPISHVSSAEYLSPVGIKQQPPRSSVEVFRADIVSRIDASARKKRSAFLTLSSGLREQSADLVLTAEQIELLSVVYENFSDAGNALFDSYDRLRLVYEDDTMVTQVELYARKRAVYLNQQQLYDAYIEARRVITSYRSL